MKTNYFKSLATLLCAGALLFSVNTKAQWTAMGGGITSGSVYAMTAFNSNIYIGGGFFSPYSDLAVWNGGSYSSGLVAGITQPVNAFATFDSVLYLATDNGIYQLIGSTSNQIAIINDPCYALCWYNHMLYAGGWMDSIGPASSRKKCGHIITYNGTTWDSIAVEVDSWPKAMTVYNGQLAVGGYMNYSSAGDTLYGIGLYNGTKWTPLSHGIKGSGGVFALATQGSNLYIGGEFDSASVGPKYGPHIFTNNIAVWNGSAWDSVGAKGTSSTVYAICAYNGGIVAGGYFDSVMFWNGAAWSSLGTTPMYSEINSTIVFNGNLYVGGEMFSTIGGTSANNVAEYTAPTGIASISNANGISIYPNPSNGLFTVEQNAENHNVKIEVYNVLGEEVYVNSFSTLRTNIDITAQASGIYIYRMLNADGSLLSTGKIIKN